MPLVVVPAALVLVFALGMALELARGHRRTARLDRVEALPVAEMPALSVVVPARDEARKLEEALRSLLAQDAGPGLEVIVVDDRSTDATAAIARRLAAADPRLRVVRVARLPPGWLGKTHALHLGAARARGELLLFTDADVVLGPGALRRAAAHLVRGGFDHVTVGPRVEMPGLLLQSFAVVIGLLFTLFTRPWKARDPRSRCHVGIGAFNLIRAGAYRAIGTHRALALRPDDDMKLGKLVKRHGFRQDLVDGSGLVSVEWYGSVGELLRGLRKNAFAALDYSLWRVGLVTLALLALFVWPFAAVLLTGGAARLLYGAALAVYLALFAGGARAQRVAPWAGVLWPVAALLFLGAMWNATLYALRYRRIEWRGTHYPLDELRAARV